MPLQIDDDGVIRHITFTPNADAQYLQTSLFDRVVSYICHLFFGA